MGRIDIRLFRLFTLIAFLVPSGETGALAQTSDERGALDRLSGSFEILAREVSPTVVQVFTTGFGATVENRQLGRSQSGGSGVLLDPEGYIVTNAHVVEGATGIQVLLATSPAVVPPGRSILRPKGELVDALLVGIDQETDIAVLRVVGTGLPAAQLGDSDQLRQGQLVLAFGSPLGLENSVSLGVVSSVARQLQPENPMIYIQTDAPINPGNSGGPLVDASGRVVGINTFILSQSGGNEGIGFAVPSNIVKNVYTQIRSGGRVKRGEIGVYAQTVTPTLARGLRLPREWGVILGDVVPGGPSDLIGLKVGDLVLSLEGKVMENGRQFDVNLYQRAVGDLVTLEVLRGDQRRSFRVRVIERKDDYGRLAEMVTPEKNLIPELGILGIEVDSTIAQMLPSPRKLGGVLVAIPSVGLPYWREGFRPGDVIYTVNGHNIGGLADLKSKLSGLKSGDAVVVHIQRGNGLRFVELRLE